MGGVAFGDAHDRHDGHGRRADHQDGAGIGWAVHLVNSAIIGAIYGATFGQMDHNWDEALGAVYGVIWWVLGALIIMPLWLGMPALQVGEMQLQSLMGHLVFGVLAGLSFTALTTTAIPTWGRQQTSGA